MDLRQKAREMEGRKHGNTLVPQALLGGSWDLVRKVVSTLLGVIGSYKYSYPSDNPSY